MNTFTFQDSDIGSNWGDNSLFISHNTAGVSSIVVDVGSADGQGVAEWFSVLDHSGSSIGNNCLW